jgi:tripartite-type tricarboxylate transporter receptor subunit TctC
MLVRVDTWQLHSRLRPVRHWWAVLALLPAVAFGQPASEAWPTKPIRLILGHSAGGSADTFSRTMAKSLAERLGQPVLVENRVGANQAIAAEATARAAPDGYTIYLASQTALVLNVGARKKLPYDSIKDFAPISLVYTIPLYLVVSPQLPVSTVKELIAFARAKPGALAFASIGTGSSVHLAAEMFRTMTGTEMLHVPYKGSVEALADLMTGRVQLMFDAGLTALPQARAGKLRVLGMTGSKRSPSIPEIPTIAESGVPGYAGEFWFGVVAPAGTPAAIVNRLAKEIAAIVGDPQLSRQFAAQGLDTVSNTPAEFARLIRDDLGKWLDVMKQAGVVPE